MAADFKLSLDTYIENSLSGVSYEVRRRWFREKSQGNNGRCLKQRLKDHHDSESLSRRMVVVILDPRQPAPPSLA